MADTKISLLTNEVTAPLQTDLLAIVSGGETKRVTRANLVGTGFTPPVVGDFTWVNQGAAVVDTAAGDGIAMTLPAGSLGTGVNFRILKKAAPATPYTITAAFQVTPLNVNYHTVCLGWRQASDGKVILFGVQVNSTSQLLLSKYTTVNGAFSAAYVSSIAARVGGAPIWLRIADDGTNRICSLSPDGKRWSVVHTVARTDYLTATEVCWGGETENATYEMLFTLLSWKVT